MLQRTTTNSNSNSNSYSLKQQFTTKINKANLPELEYECPFRLTQNHNARNQNRVTPKYPIEYLQSTHSHSNYTYMKIYTYTERERERESTSDPSSKDRMADITLTAMQRRATAAVMTLKHLQTTRKGSCRTLTLMVSLEDALSTPSSSPSLAISRAFSAPAKSSHFRSSVFFVFLVLVKSLKRDSN